MSVLNVVTRKNPLPNPHPFRTADEGLNLALWVQTGNTIDDIGFQNKLKILCAPIAQLVRQAEENTGARSLIVFLRRNRSCRKRLAGNSQRDLLAPTEEHPDRNPPAREM